MALEFNASGVLNYWSILVGQGEYYHPDFIENGKPVSENGYVTDIITNKAIDFIKGRDVKKPFALLYYHKAPHRNWMPAQRHLGVFNNTVFPEPATLFDDYNTRGKAAKEQMMMVSKHMWDEYDLKIADPAQLKGNFVKGKEQDANKEDVAGANKADESLNKMRAAYNRMTAEEQEQWDKAYAQRIKEFRNNKMSEKELVRWKYQQYMRDYMATAMSMDENVGKLLDYLQQTGELDNTIIIYSSDQGILSGRTRLV